MSSGEVTKVPSGSKLGIGFSRAVRVGDFVFVSGCAPIAREGGVAFPGDVKAQTRRCFEIIEGALTQAGADIKHVVRTRIYVTDITQWERVGKAHGEVFGDIRPASTMVDNARVPAGSVADRIKYPT